MWSENEIIPIGHALGRWWQCQRESSARRYKKYANLARALQDGMIARHDMPEMELSNARCRLIRLAYVLLLSSGSRGWQLHCHLAAEADNDCCAAAAAQQVKRCGLPSWIPEFRKCCQAAACVAAKQGGQNRLKHLVASAWHGVRVEENAQRRGVCK